jgi:Ca2+-binding EF-hand superfamily protein
VEADYMPDKVRFKSFRSCGQQLSKLLCNLDRLRWRLAKCDDVSAEIASRKAQAVKMRKNGIVPSVGLCVFNQMDVDKSGALSKDEIERVLEALAHVYPGGMDEIATIMSAMTASSNGEITEAEWRVNLAKCPALLMALIADLDYDTGRLKSYRGPEQQLAKLLGNIARCKYDLEKGQGDAAAIQAELESREAQAKKMRDAGVVPAAGVVVFNQIDKKKERKVTKDDLKELLTKLKMDGSEAVLDDLMSKLDLDGDGFVDEQEWDEALCKCFALVAALEADIDPDTGKLKCMA